MILILIPLVLLVGLMWEAWFLMILVGVVHHEWLPMVPTIGYSTAILIASILTLMALPAGLLKAT